MNNFALNFTVLSMFPEIFPGALGHSLAQKALNRLWQLQVVDIKKYALGVNGNIIDDKPYGGGSGMVLRADVAGPAIRDAIKLSNSKNIIYMSPRGNIFNQEMAQNIVLEKNLIILCGRYEGVDERIIEEFNIKEVSIGDYILSGGELPAMVLMDACIRLLPGVIEKAQVFAEESFSSSNLCGLLEYPLYTRPAIWQNKSVPKELISGNHQAIAQWKKKQAQEITKARRPDLWEKYQDRK
jgi:tRNA (guanine37-N1)-methyltransferase